MRRRRSTGSCRPPEGRHGEGRRRANLSSLSAVAVVADHSSDFLANERTFLAWVRTAVTIMAFGFVVARFGLLLKELSGASSGAVSAPISEAVGVLLVLAGTALLALAFVQFQTNRSDLAQGRYQPSRTLELLLTGLLIAVGVGLAVYLLGVA
jgi:putative membrane protein